MKTLFHHLLCLLAVSVAMICLAQQVLTPEAKYIPGEYEYEHSWDYAAPDGNGTIHCSETGKLVFNADGTYVDDAIQYHSLTMKDSINVQWGSDGNETRWLKNWVFRFVYHCEGRWRVEKGKFLFNEMEEGFSMDSMDDVVATQWSRGYGQQIVAHSTPHSNRWFAFDFERLDDEWFIWSYTYPNGRKDTWEMKRVP
ncbi:MAG: hypothetical protein K5864_06730 [Bacteroidales bacterium]|nr:hypothetical protein [Bacteroidales bacterium]